MTFYRVESVAHFGAAPEGAAIINLDDAAPFRGLSLSPAALAEVRRLHSVRFGTGRGAYLRGAYLTGAYLTGANLRDADLRDADLRGAVGLASPEEEAANIAAAVEAIAAEPQHWDQAVWHGGGFDPAAAVAVGSCGTAHCLAGWLQTLLPIGDERRELDPETCGWVLAPRAASAGWFASKAHPDLQARVDAAIAKRNASPA
jgi:uncharacterized protein YjbI with pentapeptide repeats